MMEFKFDGSTVENLNKKIIKYLNAMGLEVVPADELAALKSGKKMNEAEVAAVVPEPVEEEPQPAAAETVDEPVDKAEEAHQAVSLKDAINSLKQWANEDPKARNPIVLDWMSKKGFTGDTSFWAKAPESWAPEIMALMQ